MLRNGRWRAIYDISFLSNPTKFWGIGYVNGNNPDNETDYKKWQVAASFDLLRNIGNKLYFGPGVRYNYTRACDIEENSFLWAGQKRHASNIGIGALLAYDTRDDLNDAYSGVYLKLSQSFYPKFFENRYAFSSTELTFCWYKPISQSGLIATRLHGMFTYGNTPWGMMPMLGDNETMRGYYEGHYIDKNLVDVTVEWRQHIYKRHSAVVWIGTGEVFSNADCLSLDKLLPNVGVGYRWAFKKRVNVRLDLGFGRRQTGVIFSVNEAF
jgi:outer membrane protein assembly factor BamA